MVTPFSSVAGLFEFDAVAPFEERITFLYG
jgi:hypothetical protein